MNKRTISIPEGVFYLGEYPQLIHELPQTGSYILNKVMTGCGATTMFLEDPVPTVLCSPRRELIRCKAESDRFCGLVHSFGSTAKKSQGVIEKINDMKNYVIGKMPNPFSPQPSSPKILVTYDSCKHVIQGLQEMGLLRIFRFVVDEFQTLLTDAAFRGDVEIEFTANLRNVGSVIYLSATPIMETYLDMLPDFQNLPYIELVWPESSKHATDIQWKKYYNSSRTKTIDRIIQQYMTCGYFENTKDLAGNDCYATEAVFFVNDVGFIVTTVKKLRKMGVPDSEINVICAQEDKNEEKLAKVGLFIGHAPKEGTKHPAFTFATKASYEGTDFYSTTAYTYIFSDIRTDNMAIDISLDLPQIMGRQRLDVNPFKYSATLYYDTIPEFSEQKKAEFMENVQKKQASTNADIQNFAHSADPVKDARRIRNSQQFDKYKYDYTSVIDDKATNQLQVVMNWYVMANEIRAWEVQCSQYVNGTYVMGTANDAFANSAPSSHNLVLTFLNGFVGTFSDQMEMYSLFLDAHPECAPELMACVRIPSDIKDYYTSLGTDRMRSLGWKESAIKAAMNTNFVDMETEIINTFVPGTWYSLKDIKAKLQDIYNRHQHAKVAKAVDLKSYIICEEKKKIVRPGTREKGYFVCPQTCTTSPSI